MAVPRSAFFAFLSAATLLATGGVVGQDTFSIVAVDTVTREVGSAGASCINGSLIISDIIEGVGAVHTQALYLASNQSAAHARLAAGDTPAEIIQYMIDHDAETDPSIRQYGVVELIDSNRSAAYTGINCSDYKNHITGPTYSIQGNILLGQMVLDTMEYAFLNTPGPLADKLMAVMRAAKIPGADSRCFDFGLSSFSSFIRVVRVGDGMSPYLFRNVNASNVVDPIDSLQTLFNGWKTQYASRPDPFLSHVSMDRDSAFGNGHDRATIIMEFINNSGDPVQGSLSVQLSNTGGGVIGAAVDAGNGVYRAPITAPASLGTDTIIVAVTAQGWNQVALVERTRVTYIPQRTRLWTGGHDSLWYDLRNWNPSGVPSFFDTVVVPAVSSLPVVADSGPLLELENLTVEPGASLTVTAAGVRIQVNGRLQLDGPLYLNGTTGGAVSDTLALASDAPEALDGAGSVPQGTITRSIGQGETGEYRFESPSSAVQFDGTGTYPSSLVWTAEPGTVDTVPGFSWRIAGGAIDTADNVLTADSIGHFSMWFAGRPDPPPGTPELQRSWVIRAGGGSGFRASLRLGYLQNEVPEGVDEIELRLLRGPVFIGGVQRKWNLLSLPVEADENGKAVLFPTAESEAFAFVRDSGYAQRSVLEKGRGYWLKLPAETTVSIPGELILKDTIAVDSGWNLVGGISFAAPVEAVESIPGGIAPGPYFGYDNGYREAVTIEPLRAYWIKAAGAGSLVFRPSGAIVLPRPGGPNRRQ